MMDPATVETAILAVAAVIKAVVDVGPTVIKTIEDCKPFATTIVTTFLGRAPTADEVANLEQQLTALSQQLQQPLPPQQPDDL